jgi:competence protein ComEC
VLWPPRDGLDRGDGGGPDPNALAVVLRLRWGRFDALLTADAEAEVAPVATGRVELLKVAHHGSADSGLEALLERSRPALAVISVGEGNPYGHPAPETLAALEQARTPVLRTDTAGEVTVEVSGGRWAVR